MNNHQKSIILDFAGQYNQTLAKQIRSLGVYAEIMPYSTKIEKLKEINPIAIILTSAQDKVFDAKETVLDSNIIELGIPILGIGYGAQLLAHLAGGNVVATDKINQTTQITHSDSKIFANLAHKDCYFNFGSKITSLPNGCMQTAQADNCSIAAFENVDKKLYGVQFLLQNTQTVDGKVILKNFLYDIAKANGDWSISDFVTTMIDSLRQKIGDKKVLCAMSGGVDSAVAATLLHKAVGKQLTSVYVDHGMMRKFESEQVMDVFANKLNMNLTKIDASERFLNKLAGVTEPEQKRKIIGNEFIKVFEDFAKKMGKVDFLVQGTIYPDIVESGFGGGTLVKSHHNVGGLPAVVDFEEILEPLRDLFKDEVRLVGFELGLSEDIVMRQPFPGPGLGIRIIGDITKQKLDTLRDADFILREEIAKNGLNKEIWQYFAALTNLHSVGVSGDKRTYDTAIALRAVTSIDAMTADFAKIPYDILAKISQRIVNEVKGINRVLYDITTKPPATIELE